MEVTTVAAAGWAVMSPATSRPPLASAAGVKKPFNQTLGTQCQISISQSLRDRIGNIGGRIAESHGVPAPSLQSNSASRGCSHGEDRPAQSGNFHEPGSESSSLQRREVMGKAAALMMSLVSLPALAVAGEGELTLYQDEEDKYAILVPQEWMKGEGNAGTRKVTAFYPEADSSANVNIIITGLGADYTALGSFGTVDIFAENLVNSLDRAWQRPKGQAAKLVNARARDGMYYVEYTIQKPGEAKRHLISVVGIASNGWINRLYTVTGQYWEDDGDKYKASLEKAVSSFHFT